MNQNDIFKQEKAKILRKKTVKKILQDTIHLFHNKYYNLKIVLSPEEYPLNGNLGFNHSNFTKFCRIILKGQYQSGKSSKTQQIFDPESDSPLFAEYSFPQSFDEWECISTHIERNPDSLVIHEDGVILFVHSQVISTITEKIINLNMLSNHLHLFFLQLVPEIYAKMSYQKRLKILIKPGNLTNYHLLKGEPFEIYEFNPTKKFEETGILDLQEQYTIQLALDNIISSFHNVFSIKNDFTNG